MSTALLVIDVQKDYFANGNMELVDSLQASERIKETIDAFREKNELIIHIQHIAIKENATFFIPGTRGIEFHENVLPTPREIVIQKNFPNSFRGTTLQQTCFAHNVDKLVIVGMMTHMCIDTTTRAAFDLGFQCTVVSDCCATKDLAFGQERVPAALVQASFLAALQGTFAKVIDSKDYLRDMSF